MKFDHDLMVFSENTKTEIERVKKTSGLITRDFEINLIHFSALPWINFTAYSHARSYNWPDSCPKISFGKMDTNEGKKTMALSVHVHHGLLDGYHVGEFVNLFQNLMNS
jgi:chloramphenicol O-acetyltransferase type A